MGKKIERSKSKLRLETETLRQLRDGQLAEAAGGGATPTISLATFWTTMASVASAKHCDDDYMSANQICW